MSLKRRVIVCRYDPSRTDLTIGASLRLPQVLGSTAIQPKEAMGMLNEMGINPDKVYGSGVYGTIIGHENSGSGDDSIVVKCEQVQVVDWIFDGPYVEGIVGAALSKMIYAGVCDTFVQTKSMFLCDDFFAGIDVNRFTSLNRDADGKIARKLNKLKKQRIYDEHKQIYRENVNGVDTAARPMWCITLLDRAEMTFHEEMKKRTKDLNSPEKVVTLVNFMRNTLFSLCYALYAAQKWYRYSHRDMHTNNVMYRKTNIAQRYVSLPDLNLYFRVDNTKFDSTGTELLEACIIDQGMARAQGVLPRDNETMDTLKKIVSRSGFDCTRSADYVLGSDDMNTRGFDETDLIHRYEHVKTPFHFSSPERVVMCSRVIEDGKMERFESLGPKRRYADVFMPGYDISCFVRHILWSFGRSLRDLYNVSVSMSTNMQLPERGRGRWNNAELQLQGLGKFFKAAAPDLEENIVRETRGSTLAHTVFREVVNGAHRPITNTQALKDTALMQTLLGHEFFGPLRAPREVAEHIHAMVKQTSHANISSQLFTERPPQDEWNNLRDGTEDGLLAKLQQGFFKSVDTLDIMERMHQAFAERSKPDRQPRTVKRADATYMRSLQTSITRIDRSLAVANMGYANLNYNSSSSTLHYAVDLLDRYLSVERVTNLELVKISMCCVMIAQVLTNDAAMDEVLGRRFLTQKEVVRLCEGVFSDKEIEDCTSDILRVTGKLEPKNNAVLEMQLLNRAGKFPDEEEFSLFSMDDENMDISTHSNNEARRIVSCYICDCSLLSVSMLSYTAQEVAAASVYIACQIKYSEKAWNKNLWKKAAIDKWLSEHDLGTDPIVTRACIKSLRNAMSAYNTNAFAVEMRKIINSITEGGADIVVAIL